MAIGSKNLAGSWCPGASLSLSDDIHAETLTPRFFATDCFLEVYLRPLVFSRRAFVDKREKNAGSSTMDEYSPSSTRKVHHGSLRSPFFVERAKDLRTVLLAPDPRMCNCVVYLCLEFSRRGPVRVSTILFLRGSFVPPIPLTFHGVVLSRTFITLSKSRRRCIANGHRGREKKLGK